jgi:hypothetical protein
MSVSALWRKHGIYKQKSASWIDQLMSSLHVAPEVFPKGNPMKIGNVGKDGLGQETLLFPVSKVAEMFSVSKKSVHRALKRGLLESSSAFRHKLITRASIEKFMSNTSNGGTI